MSFTSGADQYDRFMGRYSTPLAHVFTDFARLADGDCVLDVGCGPGALARELVARFGSVGPAGSYVARLSASRRDRLRELCSERLPDASFVSSARAWAARGLV